MWPGPPRSQPCTGEGGEPPRRPIPMSLSPLINRLIEALRCLPGVGPKSAQRMAFHLLERNREAARQLAQVIEEAVTAIGRCESCRTLSEDALCPVCASSGRDPRILCVVETPADMVAVDASTAYRGMFFVLMGHRRSTVSGRPSSGSISLNGGSTAAASPKSSLRPRPRSRARRRRTAEMVRDSGDAHRPARSELDQLERRRSTAAASPKSSLRPRPRSRARRRRTIWRR